MRALVMTSVVLRRVRNCRRIIIIIINTVHVADLISDGLNVRCYRQIITTLLDSMYEHITDATVSLFILCISFHISFVPLLADNRNSIWLVAILFRNRLNLK